MLTFATPAWLTGLALAPLIRWLHRRGPDRPLVPVSHLALWRAAAAEGPAGAQRHPPDPAWRRRALVVALLCLALAGPQLPQGRQRIVLWVDDSLSMLTREPGGPRLVEGFARARSLLSDADADVETRTLGRPWRDLGAPTEAVVREVVAGAGAGDGERGPPPRALLRAGTQNWLVTDGAHPQILAWGDERRPDRVIAVGSVVRNVGVERLSARRSLGESGNDDVVVRVANGGSAREVRDVVVTSAQGAVQRSKIELEPGASALVRASLPGSTKVDVALEPGDALPDDDTMDVDLRALRARSIAVDARCPRAIVSAVAAHPALRVAPGGEGPPDAVIDCGGIRPAARLPAVRVHADQVPVAAHAPVQWSASVADSRRIGIDVERTRVAARLEAGRADRVLLALGGDPAIVRRNATPPIVDTSLDFSDDTLGRPDAALLIDFMFGEIFGERLLDDVAVADRGSGSARVVPGGANAATAATVGVAPASDRGWATSVLAAAMGVVIWELLALARRSPRWNGRNASVAALQAAALASVAAALLGIAWLGARSGERVLALVDRSQSVPRAAADAALAREIASSSGVVEILEFAGQPGAPSTRALRDATMLEPAATNVEAALDAALAAHAARAFDRAIVVSDGMENAGDARRALRAIRDAGPPLKWVEVARPPPQTRIADVLAPQRAALGQAIRVTVHVSGPLDRPLRLTGLARTPDGGRQQASGEPDEQGRATLSFEATAPGAMTFDVALADASSEEALDVVRDAAAVDVAASASILYVRGSPGSLAQSLSAGGWPVETIPAGRMDSYADGLGSYRAVVLDDVAVGDASQRFWRSLAGAVQGRGLGLVVLGGERSFARGGYGGSDLESVLPVASEPAALAQPLAVVFAVDKSGSMGRGSAGVDRFALAQRAVNDTMRGLGERDSAGVLLFDVEPRVLVPLRSAPDAADVLARRWPATPHGGTRLAPAVAAAIDELERSSAARRMLVVVTDGFVDNASLADLRARLERARIETIAFAVGPDADASALQRLATSVIRVGEAAELPLAMRSSIERRRARIEHGTIGAKQEQALPFSPGRFADWPPVAAYAVTRSRPNATVAVRSDRGDPLIAFAESGQGRVVAVTSGLGRWSPQWLRWPEWPRLAGGLASWAAASGEANVAIAVSESPAGMRVDADVRDVAGWAGPEQTAITVTTPAGEQRAALADYVAPGRFRTTLPDAGAGVYKFAVSTPQGSQRLLHVRSKRAERDTWGVNPAIEAWRSEGLVDNAGTAAAPRRSHREPDGSFIALALALALAGVAVDRWRTAESMRPILDRASARLRNTRAAIGRLLSEARAAAFLSGPYTRAARDRFPLRRS